MHDPSDPTGTVGASEGEGRSLVSRRAMEIGASLATLALGLLVIKGALEFETTWSDRGPEPGYFPFWLGVLVCIGSAGTLVSAVGSRRREMHLSALTTSQAGRALAFLLPIVGFVGATSVLGLYVGMVLYLFTVMVVQGKYRIWLAASVSVGSALFFYFMFDRWLRVPLMMGPLEAWLGLH